MIVDTKKKKKQEEKINEKKKEKKESVEPHGHACAQGDLHAQKSPCVQETCAHETCAQDLPHAEWPACIPALFSFENIFSFHMDFVHDLNK